MISPDAMEQQPITPLAAEMIAIADEARIYARIQEVADYIGPQEDGKGGFIQLYNLRQQLGKHPKGSTVSRQTIVRELSLALPAALAPKYGSGQVDTRSIDLKALEQPAKGICGAAQLAADSKAEEQGEGRLPPQGRRNFKE